MLVKVEIILVDDEIHREKGKLDTTTVFTIVRSLFKNRKHIDFKLFQV